MKTQTLKWWNVALGIGLGLTLVAHVATAGNDKSKKPSNRTANARPVQAIAKNVEVSVDADESLKPLISTEGSDPEMVTLKAKLQPKVTTTPKADKHIGSATIISNK